MSNFRITRLRLISRRENSGLDLDFDPKVTIIQGQNDTGKSSVMKSIFWCFGAEPAKTNEKWSRLDIHGAVDFTVNGINYIITRHGRHFGLFTDTGEKILTTTHITSVLGKKLAGIWGFNLLLSNKSSREAEIPPPAFYLLPYYIDQDAGWSGTWCSFDNLAQYSAWTQDVAEYHMGLRDNDYYRMKTELAAQKAALDEPSRAEQVLANALDRVRKRFSALPMNFDLDKFKAEIEELLKVATPLADEEEKYRQRLGEMYSQRVGLSHQIEIIRRSRTEIQKDYEYSLTAPSEVECPTCGAHYTNSIAERFRLAIDDDQLDAMLVDLRGQVANIDVEIDRARERLNRVHGEHARIWEMLNVRREAVSLNQILQGEARGQAVSVLQDELESIRETIGRIGVRIKEIQARIRKYSSKDRKQKFLREFLEWIESYSVELRVRPPGVTQFNLSLHETGSDLPRLVLAHAFAMLQMNWKYATTAKGPVVIDSPNQQDQDAENLSAMLTFIKRRRPEDMQLVLGFVDSQGVDFGGKVHSFTRKYGVLTREGYQAVSGEMGGLLNSVYGVVT